MKALFAAIRAKFHGPTEKDLAREKRLLERVCKQQGVSCSQATAIASVYFSRKRNDASQKE